jgi:hypothetical protein
MSRIILIGRFERPHIKFYDEWSVVADTDGTVRNRFVAHL